jgi:hypothetical protein
MIKTFEIWVKKLRGKKSNGIKYSGIAEGFAAQMVPLKARDIDFDGRFREIIADPVNMLIKRDPLAGCIDDGKVVLHNGIKVPAGGPFAYYGDFSKILITNRGVHEPLEEFCFQEVLKEVSGSPVMLELGAYWGHYSMWCQSVLPKARQYLVEPEKANLEIAKRNFSANKFNATFICDFVGKDHFSVDEFMRTEKLSKLDILHSDIQGFETEMLQGASDSLGKHLIDYCFVSTHSKALHADCIKILKGHGYDVTVSANFDTETTSHDGFILASSPNVKPVLKDFWFFTREQCGGLSVADYARFLNQFKN